MANSTIIARLEKLADEFEAGRASLDTLANELVGHAEALERMDYHRIKEAQSVQAQLSMAIEQHRARDVDTGVLLGWLRNWIKALPGDVA